LLLLSRVVFGNHSLAHFKRKMAPRKSNASAEAEQEADEIVKIAGRNLKEVLNSFKNCVQVVQKTKRMLELDPKCICVNSESKWERRKGLYAAAESIEATMEFLFRNISRRAVEASLVHTPVSNGLENCTIQDDDLLWCDRVCVLEMPGVARAPRAPGSSGEESRRRPASTRLSTGQEILQQSACNESGLNDATERLEEVPARRRVTKSVTATEVNPLDPPDMGAETPGLTLEKKTPRKNGLWSTAHLDKAIEMIEGGAKIKAAAKAVNIPASSVRDHLFGKRKGRKRGRERILNDEEENDLKTFLQKMQDSGQPFTPTQLKLKVAQLTQTRVTPFVDGIPGKSWMKRFRRRHPDLENLVQWKSRPSKEVQGQQNLEGSTTMVDVSVADWDVEHVQVTNMSL
jgi:hypothetical protein